MAILPRVLVDWMDRVMRSFHLAIRKSLKDSVYVLGGGAIQGGESVCCAEASVPGAAARIAAEDARSAFGLRLFLGFFFLGGGGCFYFGLELSLKKNSLFLPQKQRPVPRLHLPHQLLPAGHVPEDGGVWGVPGAQVDGFAKLASPVSWSTAVKSSCAAEPPPDLPLVSMHT